MVRNDVSKISVCITKSLIDSSSYCLLIGDLSMSTDNKKHLETKRQTDGKYHMIFR